MIIDILFNALLTTICFTVPLPERIKLRYKFLMFTCSFILTHLLSPTSFSSVSCILFNFIMVLFLTKNKTINGISALISYIFSVVSNNLMLVFMQNVLKLDVPTILSNQKALIIFCFCFLVIVYLTSMLIGNFFKYFISKSDFANSPNTLVLIFVELMLCATILVFNITYAKQIGYPQNTILFNCLLFSVYFILSSLLLINIVSSTKKNILMKQELEHTKQLQEYTESIEYHANQLREFKHDYLNTLLTLDELVHESKNQKLIEFFDEQIKPTGLHVQNINTSMVALKNIKDTAVKSLLYNKLSYALAKDIKLHLLLNFVIHEFPMNSMDLSKLLGIYLDNAIEGALTSDSPKLAVIFTKSQNITLEISNSFSGTKPELAQLYKKGYSTKGENRGIGLAQANELLDKYPNVVPTVDASNNVFTQLLSFSNN